MACITKGRCSWDNSIIRKAVLIKNKDEGDHTSSEVCIIFDDLEEASNFIKENNYSEDDNSDIWYSIEMVQYIEKKSNG